MLKLAYERRSAEQNMDDWLSADISVDIGRFERIVTSS